MKTGEVVMAVSGAVGLPAILSVDACIHDGFVGFRSLSDEVSSEYFYNFLAAYRRLSIGQAVGATFQNLKTDQVRAWLVPLPTRAKQAEFNRVAADMRSLEKQQAVATATAQAIFDALLAQVFAKTNNVG
jgi:restriction endonuclease S subunit